MAVPLIITYTFNISITDDLLPTFNDEYANNYSYSDTVNDDGSITRHITSNNTSIKPTSMRFDIDSDALIYVDYINGGDLTNFTTGENMFANCKNLASFNYNSLASLDTSKMTSMSGMFYNCYNLTSLDLSNFNTSNVTNMNNMFSDCGNLTTLDVSSFDTSKVTDMSYMFFYCTKLPKIEGLNSFDTGNVTTMQRMFNACSVLTSLDLSSFDTSKVTDMSYMFYHCNNLTSVDLSSFDTSEVKNMSYMFYECDSLTTIEGIDDWITDNVNDISYIFLGCENLLSLDLSKWNTTNITDMRSIFNNCNKLTSVGDLSDWNTSNVTDMGHMFYYCENITSLDVNSFNTINVTDMFEMFTGCKKLTSIDVSNWDTRNVTNMGSMFSNCEKLTTVNISGLNLTKIHTITYFFENCYELTTITGLETLDVSNITSFYRFFRNCRKLTSVEGIRNWNVSKCQFFYGMFDKCYVLKEIPVDNWNAQNCESMGYFACECRALEKINLRGFNLAKLPGDYPLSNSFFGCYSLKRLDIGGRDMTLLLDVNTLRPSYETQLPLAIEYIDMSGQKGDETNAPVSFEFIDYEEYGGSPNLKEIVMLNSNAYTANKLISSFKVVRTNGATLYLSPNEKDSVDISTANSKGWNVKFVDVKLGSNHVPLNLGNNTIEKMFFNDTIVYEINRPTWYNVEFEYCDGVAISNRNPVPKGGTYITQLSWISGRTLMAYFYGSMGYTELNELGCISNLTSTGCTLTVNNVQGDLHFERLQSAKETVITYSFSKYETRKNRYGYNEYYIICDSPSISGTTSISSLYDVHIEVIYTGTKSHSSCNAILYNSSDTRIDSCGISNLNTTRSRVARSMGTDISLSELLSITKAEFKLDNDEPSAKVQIKLHLYYR